MQNTQNGILKRQQMLVELINNLKEDTSAEKEKLRILENKEKLQECSRNTLEVKKDELSHNIAFYETYLKKVNAELEPGLMRQEKYTLMNEGYDQIVKICREKYLTESNSKPDTESRSQDLSLETKQKISTLLIEKEKVRAIIEKNSNRIKCLLNSLEQE